MDWRVTVAMLGGGFVLIALFGLRGNWPLETFAIAIVGGTGFMLLASL